MITVTSWGLATSIVDAGSPGRAWLGQSRGGAVDVSSLRLANRLVGNTEAAAAFETSGGLALAFDAPTMVAAAGAVATIVVTGAPALGWGAPVALPAGATLRVGRLEQGARLYLAVRGGCGAPAGNHCSVGPDPGTPVALQAAPRPELPGTIRLWPGPRLDWFADGTWQQLLSEEFLVTATSRVGTRLSGARLQRTANGELPSEGVLEGAVQVPPDGDPIVMLADHPTTGGYPVVAVVDPGDVSVIAQAAPGARIRFRGAVRL